MSFPIPNTTSRFSCASLIELGLTNGFTEQVFMMLDEQFSINELQDAVRRVLRQFRAKHVEWEPISQRV